MRTNTLSFGASNLAPPPDSLSGTVKAAPPARAHDGVRSLYRHNVAEIDGLMARLSLQLEGHGVRYAARPYDLAAVGQLADVALGLRRLTDFLSSVEARTAARAAGGAR